MCSWSVLIPLSTESSGISHINKEQKNKCNENRFVAELFSRPAFWWKQQHICVWFHLRTLGTVREVVRFFRSQRKLCNRFSHSHRHYCITFIIAKQWKTSVSSSWANNTFHCSCRRQRVTQEHRRDLGHCYEALSICRLGHNHIDYTLVNNK